MPTPPITAEFRSEIRTWVQADRFDVVSYSFRDGGVEATITAFLKFGDLPVPAVAKIIESVPAPQREKVWRDMVPSMSEADLLEGVTFGVVPIEVLSAALQMKLPAHVLYENGSKISVEVLIGALKGVDKKGVMDLIKTLPAAKQKQVWEGYIATLSPEEIAAGVKSGQIPEEYGPPPDEYVPNFPDFGDWKVSAEDEDGRSIAYYRNRAGWQVACFVYPVLPQESFLVLNEGPRRQPVEVGSREGSFTRLNLPKTWSGDQKADDRALTRALKDAWPKMDQYINTYSAKHK